MSSIQLQNIQKTPVTSEFLPSTQQQAITTAGKSGPYLWNTTPAVVGNGGVGGTWSNNGATWSPGQPGTYTIFWTTFSSGTAQEFVIAKNTVPVDANYNVPFNNPSQLIGYSQLNTKSASNTYNINSVPCCGIFIATSATDTANFFTYVVDPVTPNQARTVLRIVKMT